MIIHSIKWRLQAWHSFMLVCLVACLMTGFYTFERNARFQAIDNELAEAMQPLLPRYAPPGERERGQPGPPDRDRRGPPGEEDFPPPPEGRRFDDGPPEPRGAFGRPPSEHGRGPELFDSKKIYFAAWSEDGERIGASTNAPSDLPRPDPHGPNQGRLVRTRGAYRELAQFVPTGRSLLVGESLAPTLAQLHTLALALVFIGCGIVVTGFAVGWWLATRALRPVAEISQAAREIAAGDLSKRINAAETESELGQLIAVLNSTFARLDAAFAQQKQFTSDASHELRTPVSVILTQTQSVLARER